MKKKEKGQDSEFMPQKSRQEDVLEDNERNKVMTKEKSRLRVQKETSTYLCAKGEYDTKEDDIKISHKNEILLHKHQKVVVKVVVDGLQVEGKIYAQKEIKYCLCVMNEEYIPYNLFKFCMSAHSEQNQKMLEDEAVNKVTEHRLFPSEEFKSQRYY